jgi:recombination protein RecT
VSGQQIDHRRPHELSKAQQLVAQVRQPDFAEQVKLALGGDDGAAGRFIRVMSSAFLANPDLAEKCEWGSILQSAIKCAAMGLIPDGNEAAFVPFFDKKAKVTKAQLVPMIGGYRKIAGEYGWTIQTRVIHRADEFSATEEPPSITHRTPRLGKPRGPMIGAYAVARHRDGRTMFEVMDIAELERVRRSSAAGQSGPWREWTDRMYEKTPGRRLFKKLPLSDTDRRVPLILQADEIPDAAAALYGPAETRALTTAPDEEPEGAGVSHAGVHAPEGAGDAAGGDTEPLAAAASPFQPPPDVGPLPEVATEQQRDRLDELFGLLTGDDPVKRSDFIAAAGGEPGDEWEWVRDQMTPAAAQTMIDHLERLPGPA